MALSKASQKELDKIMACKDWDIAARALAAFHRSGNKREQKAADELRSAHHGLLERTLYINDCMIHKDDYRR